MLDLARDIIGTQPILTAFLAIGVGYLVGQINIFGFSLGVGAVLFVGLAIGAFAPKAQIIGPIGLTGLIMFLYGIGILYGRQFFEGMVGSGRKYNLLALVACLAGLAVALGLGHVFGIKTRPHARPLRRIDDEHRDASGGARRHQEQGSVDRLLDRLSVRRDRPDPVHLLHDADGAAEISRQGAALSHGRDFHRREALPAARSTSLTKEFLHGVQVTMVRKAGQNIVPVDDTVLSAGDAVLVVAESQEAIANAAAQAREAGTGPAGQRRSDLDYIRVFVGKASVVGMPLSSLPMPSGFPAHTSACSALRCRPRAVARPDARIRRPGRRADAARSARKKSASTLAIRVKATAEFSYVSLGLGMVLGVLLGLIPIPIPGVGIVTLGIGGGPLIVALILGKLRRTGPMLWTMPLPANIVLRNFGLAMFLATVGVNAGQPFVRTVAEFRLHACCSSASRFCSPPSLIVLLVGSLRHENPL